MGPQNAIRAGQRAKINYTNHRNETTDRVIKVDYFFFGADTWHPEPQMLLEAFDEEKRASRTFAVKDIHSWELISN